MRMSLCKSAMEIAMDQQIDWQAVRVLALLEAKRQVKRRLQSEGRFKVPLLSASTISRLAKDHLQAHPELYKQAMQSDLALHNSTNSIKSRRPRNQGLLVCKSHERNGGPQ